MVREQGLTLVHSEARVRDEAMRKLRGMIGFGRTLDCPLNIGLFRGSAIEGKPIAYSKDLLVEILREACGHAQQASVILTGDGLDFRAILAAIWGINYDGYVSIGLDPGPGGNDSRPPGHAGRRSHASRHVSLSCQCAAFPL
jgi:sugar phosphate isomerase/epimerase